MMFSLQKAALGAAGLTALCIGAAITFAPHNFYASYGIALSADANLLSELRAPGANLAVLGAAMCAGVFRHAWADRMTALAALVFLAFAFGRVVSLTVDGLPGGAIVGALVFEVVIGSLCLLALLLRGRNEVGLAQHA